MPSSSMPSIQYFLSKNKSRLLYVSLNDAAQFARADALRLALQVGRAVTVGESLTDRVFERLRLAFEFACVSQQQRRRSDRAERIGDAFTSDVGRGAVNRLIQSDFAADARRRKHSERPGQHRGFIAQDVAE